MKTISIINNKGGVGKTTTVFNLGYEFSEHLNKKVLLIDLDAQANLSQILKIVSPDIDVANVLMGGTYIKDAIKKTEYKNMDILPASGSLDTAYEALESSKNKTILKNALMAIQDQYDYCIIDNAPAITIGTHNSLVASNDVIVPMCVDVYGFWGLNRITNIIQEARIHNPTLNFAGCVLTRYVNDDTSKEVAGQLKQQSNYPIAATFIRESKMVRKSTFDTKPISESSYRSSSAVDYRRLAKQYIDGNLCS